MHPHLHGTNMTVCYKARGHNSYLDLAGGTFGQLSVIEIIIVFVAIY